jgi:CBS-domain-containing membrane protein
LLGERRIGALPVVDGTDLVGIVTCADVLGYFLELLRSSGDRPRPSTRAELQ